MSKDIIFGEEAAIVRDKNFQVLLLININAPLGIALLSPLLDSLAGTFGVLPTRIGLLITVFTAPSVVMIPLVGILADRYGRKPMLLAGLLLFGTAGSAISLTTSFPVVLGLRALQGIAHAGLTPIIITSIGDLYADAKEATAQGIRFSTSGITQAVFPLIASILITVGWRYPFLMYVLAFPMAIIVWFRFQETKNQMDRIESPQSTQLDQISELVKSAIKPRVLTVLVVRGIPNFVYFGFLTYNSIVVVKLLERTPWQAGLLVTITSLVYAGTATQAGRITSVFDGRAIPLVIAHLCLGGGMALIATAPSFLVVTIAAVSIGIGVGIAAPLLRSVITKIGVEKHRGGIVALGESSGRLASTIAPVAMGVTVGVFEPLFGFDVAIRGTIFGFGFMSAVIGSIGIYFAVITSRTTGNTIVN
jgi:ACDE family multidrug resistance protein